MIKFNFDLGCNIGKWIDANDNGVDMFVGVEPNPELYERVKRKYQDNTRIQILNYLVAEVDDEERDFYVSLSSPDAEVSTASLTWKNKSRHNKTTGWADPIKVKTITLDTLIAQYGVPSTVKIDVEGYEFNVLRGLSQKCGDISFEWVAEDFNAAIACLGRLEELGYHQFNLQGADDDPAYKPSGYCGRAEILSEFKEMEGTTAWGMLYARYIDFKVKIISLETRPERLQAALSELPKIGVTEYEWFPAFTGGALGCDKSHNACLAGEGPLLILEDDVVFEPGAFERMNKAICQLPDDWDILYLGANVKAPASRHSDNLFRVRSGVHTTHAMLYSAKGRQSMHDLYHPGEKDIPTIDHWLYTEGLNLMNCYVVWPMIAYQRADHSDIRLAYYDYKQEMMDNQKLHME